MVTTTIVVVVGYLAVGRAFAYIGLPSVGIFLGEVLLVGAFLFRPLRDRILQVMSQLVDGGPFHLLMWALTAFLGYGLVQLVYGKLQGYPIRDIIFNLPFNYYALFIPVGVAIGALDNRLLPRLVRALAWTNAIYGVVFLLLLQHLNITLPWAQGVALTGPAGSALAILGLLCFEPDFRRDWYLYAANFFMMLAMQMRGEWVGFVAAFLIWSILKRNVRVMASGLAIVALIFTFMSVFGIEIPASSTRGGTISAEGVLARSIAPFNKDLATRYSDQADVFAGTASWRETWWKAIGQSVTQDSKHLVFGNGYGFELRSLVSYVEPGVRTPHSVYYYAIGYSGFLGLAVFVALQVAALQALNGVRRMTGEVFGFLVIASGFGLGMFGNYFETPFGAIPYYLLLGLCLSPLLRLPVWRVGSRYVLPVSLPPRLRPAYARITGPGGRRLTATALADRSATPLVEPLDDVEAPEVVEPLDREEGAPPPAIAEPSLEPAEAGPSDVPADAPVPVDSPPTRPAFPTMVAPADLPSFLGVGAVLGLQPTARARLRFAQSAKDNLHSMTAGQLRRLAKARGLPRAAAMKKRTLLAALEADLDRELGGYGGDTDTNA